MFKGWTHLKTGHAGQNHSPPSTVLPRQQRSKNAAVASWSKSSNSNNKKQQKEEEEEEEEEEKVSEGEICGDSLASSHSSTECQLLK